MDKINDHTHTDYNLLLTTYYLLLVTYTLQFMKAECSIYGWHGDFKAHLIAFRTIESELFWEKTQRDPESTFTQSKGFIGIKYKV